MADITRTCTVCERNFTGHQRVCRTCRRRAASSGELKPRGPLAERLWRKVSVARPDQCWAWTGTLTPNGYGRVREGAAGSPLLQVHRVAYEVTIGPIPEGLEIDHTCCNRACCNPAHLEPVTHAENLRRGRERRNGAS